MHKDNFYVAFSAHVYPYVHIQGSNNLDVTERYGDLYVYCKDTGRVESLYHITYNQLYEAYYRYSNDCKISLTPTTPKGNYLDPRYCSFLWKHMSCVIDVLLGYVHGEYVVLDKQQNDSKLLSYTEYLGDRNTNNIRDHHSLLITDYDYGRHLYIGGLTATQLHEQYEELKTLSLTHDDWCDKRKNFAQFITTIINTMECWKYTSFDEFHKNIWDHYCGHVKRKDIVHEILDGENKCLPQDIVIQKYDENTTLSQRVVLENFDSDPEVFHENVGELVEDVNHEYNLLNTYLKSNGLELKKVSKDENYVRSSMDVASYLHKNIGVSFILEFCDITDIEPVIRIVISNLNDRSGDVLRYPIGINPKSIRDNINPSNRCPEFTNLLDDMNDDQEKIIGETVPNYYLLVHMVSRYVSDYETPRIRDSYKEVSLSGVNGKYDVMLGLFKLPNNDCDFMMNFFEKGSDRTSYRLVTGKALTGLQILEYVKDAKKYEDGVHAEECLMIERRLLKLLKLIDTGYSWYDAVNIIFTIYGMMKETYPSMVESFENQEDK